jgi:hypothetical protein
MQNRFVKHWRDVWEPESDFVFLRKLANFSLDPRGYVLPGDPVTPEIRAALGEERLRVWWKGRTVATKDYAIQVGIRQSKSAPETAQYTATGRGWFQVRLADGTIQKVRGRENAEKLLAKTE